MGLIHDHASNEVLDQFFVLPEKLDFSHPEFQKLSDATASKDAYLGLMTDSLLQDVATALADAL